MRACAGEDVPSRQPPDRHQHHRWTWTRSGEGWPMPSPSPTSPPGGRART